MRAAGVGLDLAEQGSIEAVLLHGMQVLAGNLLAGRCRPELRGIVQSAAPRVAGLRADNAGLFLNRDNAILRLKRPNRKPGFVEELAAQIRTGNCGCVIGSADLLDLARPAACVRDGSFYGSRTRVYIVECDEDSLALALATFDVRDVLADEAVTWVCGARALEQLEHHLAAREDESPANITVSSNPHVAGIVDRTYQCFCQKVERLYEQASAYYAGLPAEHWLDVLSDSPSRPPRVLMITTEFSSFMKHATRDVASAFERMGWQVQVAKESEATQAVTGMMIARSVASFRPDLIWQINYMRNAWKGAIPDGVPFVCWDQDSMPHLARREQASMMGRFDFLACLGSGLPYVRWYGYAPDRILTLPMGVDRSVFYPEPDACPVTDICFVSHHGLSPSQRMEELLASSGAGDNPGLRMIVGNYTEYLETLLEKTSEPVSKEESDEVVSRICQGGNLTVDQASVAFLNDYLFRIIGNAVWRQQAVRWAAETTTSLRLYGMGWDRNEEFSRFAGGVVEHGDALRRVFGLHQGGVAGSPCRECPSASMGGFGLWSDRVNAIQSWR